MATHMLGKAVRITTVNVCDRKERFVRKLTVVCCFPLCRSGIRSVFIAAYKARCRTSCFCWSGF